MKPRIKVWFADDCWHASSSDKEQGYVGGSLEVVLFTVEGWMKGEQ